MLKRHKPRTPSQQMREALWPSMGFRRLIKYYRHRMGRMPGTPYYSAAGFATGVAVSFTPFIGFHTLLGAICAWMIRGSFIAMVVGGLLGNPWTFPFIWYATYEVGVLMMGAYGSAAAEQIPEALTLAVMLDKPFQLFVPMMLGSIPFMIMSWIISFYLVRHVVKKYKEERRVRIHHNRKNN